MSAWTATTDEIQGLQSVVADELLDDTSKRYALQKAMFDASQNGNFEEIHLLLADSNTSSYIDINAKDTAGSTALIYSSCFGQESVVTELLRFGADPDIQDQNEWTALMWAANNNHVGIVRRLIEAGADLMIKTSTGRSVIDFCSPGSTVYSYMSAKGFLEDRDSVDFYKKPTIPDEDEELFEARLEESTNTLKLKTMGISSNDDLGETFGLSIQAHNPSLMMPEFNWEHFYIDQSFALNANHIPQFLDVTITQVRPTLVKNQAPVSANALFLALRYFHYCDSGNILMNFLSPICRRIFLVVQANSDDFVYLSYWLANTGVLLYYVQRDPGVNDATKDGFQIALAQLIDRIQFLVISCAEALLDEHLKPCLLEYESIPGIHDIVYKGDWLFFQRHKKHIDAVAEAVQVMMPPSSDKKRRPSPAKVTSILSSIKIVFETCSVHPLICHEVYSQLLYWMGSYLFNSVLETRKYMARARAMQIRLNISAIEDWCRVNNCRPDDGSEFSDKHTYRSLADLCRMHLGSLCQILQWLQCFSGFDSDFTNVVATMQELKFLNPRQLLYSAKRYRAELNEKSLSKEYKHYLEDLVKHYDSNEKSQGKHKSSSKLKLNERTQSSYNTDLDFEKQPDADSPKHDINILHMRSSSVLTTYPPITASDIYLDPCIDLPSRLPTLKECIVFWGGGLGGTETNSGHYFVPIMPGEISDTLDAFAAGEVYDEVDAPEATQKAYNNEIDVVSNADLPSLSTQVGFSELSLDEPVW